MPKGDLVAELAEKLLHTLERQRHADRDNPLTVARLAALAAYDPKIVRILEDNLRLIDGGIPKQQRLMGLSGYRRTYNGNK